MLTIVCRTKVSKSI